MNWPVITINDILNAAWWDGSGEPPEAPYVLLPDNVVSLLYDQQRQLFDKVWQNDDREFIVFGGPTMGAQEWVPFRQDPGNLLNVIPTRREFGWIDSERTPICKGDILHLEDVYYRNQCGYRLSTEEHDWCCTNQNHEDAHYNDGPFECRARCCPVAYCADSRRQLESIGLAEQYDFVEADEGCGPEFDYAEDCEWMEFHSRVADGMCPNLWIGFVASNKLEWRRNVRAFQWFRGVSRYLKLFGVVDESVPQWRFSAGMDPDYHWVHASHPMLWWESNGQKVMPYLNELLTVDTCTVHALKISGLKVV